jgi:hypothetical protein
MVEAVRESTLATVWFMGNAKVFTIFQEVVSREATVR